MLDKTWFIALEVFSDSACSWWRIVLKPGYSVHKVRHVCVLSNVEMQLPMRVACSFPRPWQLFGSAERLNFLGGASSGVGFKASYASRCLLRWRRWSRVGLVGPPKLAPLSVEWRHSIKVQVELCEPPCLERKFLSALVYRLLCHANTVFYWSSKCHLWKDCTKPHCCFVGELKSKLFLLNQCTAWFHKCLCFYSESGGKL